MRTQSPNVYFTLPPERICESTITTYVYVLNQFSDEPRRLPVIKHFLTIESLTNSKPHFDFCKNPIEMIGVIETSDKPLWRKGLLISTDGRWLRTFVIFFLFGFTCYWLSCLLVVFFLSRIPVSVEVQKMVIWRLIQNHQNKLLMFREILFIFFICFCFYSFAKWDGVFFVL